MQAEDDLIEYRYLNMDNECRTTSDRLLKYASDFPGGTHRVVTSYKFGGPMLQAYGTRPFPADAVIRLDERLPPLNGVDHGK